MSSTRSHPRDGRARGRVAEGTVGKPAARFVLDAKRLQDVIGAHQDAVVAEERVRSLLDRAEGARAHFAAGRIVERERERRREARAAFPAAWARLEKSGSEPGAERGDRAGRRRGRLPGRRGGVLEVLVVHRPKYDDWTLPKGKLEPGETHEQAALREVEEETGFTCELGRELPSTSYRDSRDRPKVVRYWAMRPLAGALSPHHEVDEVRWASVEQAKALLSHDHDQGVLDTFATNER